MSGGWDWFIIGLVFATVAVLTLCFGGKLYDFCWGGRAREEDEFFDALVDHFEYAQRG